MSNRYRIAVIPGDGIGTEVMPEGVRAIQAAAQAYDFELELTEFDFSSAAYWQQQLPELPPEVVPRKPGAGRAEGLATARPEGNTSAEAASPMSTR